MFEGQEEAQRKILNRLKRARGQLDAVINAVEAGAPCKDVVTQLSATSSALDRAGFAIISTAMKECVMENGELVEAAGISAGAGNVVAGGAQEERLTVEELEKLFMMLA